MATDLTVFKFGSGVLASTKGNALDERQFRRLTTELAGLVQRGQRVVVVTSGAVAAGLDVLGEKERPSDLAARQACAAVGQPRLMEAWSRHFATHGLGVAQLLLTYADLDSRKACENVRRMLDHLFARGGVVPIINENDSVAVEELKFGDNDRLSAEAAVLFGASRLVLLTSVDGLLDKKGETVPVVKDLAAARRLVRAEKGRLSVGGMESKLEAVGHALAAGVEVFIASGREPGRIKSIGAGKAVGTHFPKA